MHLYPLMVPEPRTFLFIQQSDIYQELLSTDIILNKQQEYYIEQNTNGSTSLHVCISVKFCTSQSYIVHTVKPKNDILIAPYSTAT